jgi:hypothetical protein
VFSVSITTATATFYIVCERTVVCVYVCRFFALTVLRLTMSVLSSLPAALPQTEFVPPPPSVLILPTVGSLHCNGEYNPISHNHQNCNIGEIVHDVLSADAVFVRVDDGNCPSLQRDIMYKAALAVSRGIPVCFYDPFRSARTETNQQGVNVPPPLRNLFGHCLTEPEFEDSVLWINQGTANDAMVALCDLVGERRSDGVETLPLRAPPNRQGDATLPRVHLTASWFSDTFTVRHLFDLCTRSGVGTVALDWGSTSGHQSMTKASQFEAIVDACVHSDAFFISIQGMDERESAASYIQMLLAYAAGTPIVVHHPLGADHARAQPLFRGLLNLVPVTMASAAAPSNDGGRNDTVACLWDISIAKAVNTAIEAGAEHARSVFTDLGRETVHVYPAVKPSLGIGLVLATRPSGPDAITLGPTITRDLLNTRVGVAIAAQLGASWRDTLYVTSYGINDSVRQENARLLSKHFLLFGGRPNPVGFVSVLEEIQSRGVYKRLVAVDDPSAYVLVLTDVTHVVAIGPKNVTRALVPRSLTIESFCTIAGPQGPSSAIINIVANSRCQSRVGECTISGTRIVFDGLITIPFGGHALDSDPHVTTLDDVYALCLEVVTNAQFSGDSKSRDLMIVTSNILREVLVPLRAYS